MVIGAAALGTIGWVFHRATAEQRAWRELLSYAGKPLDKLDPAEMKRFKHLVSLRVPPRGEEMWMEPWGFYRLDPEGGALVVEAVTSFSIPGPFGVRVHLFDRYGRRVSGADFSGGWRMSWTTSALLHSANAGGPVLKVKVYNGNGGADIDYQYYAPVGGQIALIRLEDFEGRFAANDYWASNLIMGPCPPRRSAEEWEKALRSAQPAEVLRTLCWLGGKHHSPQAEERDSYHESLEDSRRVVEVRARVRPLLLDLTKSPNPWIAEAAASSLKQ